MHAQLASPVCFVNFGLLISYACTKPVKAFIKVIVFNNNFFTLSDFLNNYNKAISCRYTWDCFWWERCRWWRFWRSHHWTLYHWNWCTIWTLMRGELNLIYSYPEALFKTRFAKLLRSKLYQDTVCAVVIDEVHMISEW